MKKLITVSIILLSVSIILFSCKKSSSSSNSTSGSYSLVFNGTTFTGSTFTCILHNNSIDSMLEIDGSSTGLSPAFSHPPTVFSIEIKIPSSSTVIPGTYSVSQNDNNIVDFAQEQSANVGSSYTAYLASDQYPQVNVTVIIDSFNSTTKYVHCTFSGTLRNNYNQNDSTDYPVNGSISGIVQYGN